MSQIRLNKNSYDNNLKQIINKVGTNEQVILILKDNAYGHGARILGQRASELGFEFCAVKDEREANELSDIFKKILILSHIPNGNESEKFIYATNDLRALKTIKSGAKIHLAVDTLMHRNGIDLSEIDEALGIIKERKLELLGAFTHFRSGDILNAEYFIQRQNFKIVKEKVAKFLSQKGLKNPTFHSHNSAGFERFNELDGELVRIGITQFGYNQFDKNIKLTPVLSLWANKISERILKARSSVGYGGKFCAKVDMKIATYDLGYGDGLFRYDGEGGLKLANGNEILGKMSMDSFSSNDVGDEVCVFDDARVWARFFNTIEYEILAKLSPFLKRVWV
ncbi:alanine racemase [Campylobacter gastrosuis]|uniref:Alanine racemase n=1 Tax=Campylobacter gastrosuis TaxID=2974576 RepID=A0ABT7HNH1_9BACT|nr:alanine racemase [Campylobacter gastrosuis]MDL0088476.1 alanine racemase [Campylobacter gastrosuis]